MHFLNRNTAAIQALAAIFTVLIALAALVGVKWQIDAADRIQQAQSARDIYREYLSMAINKPEYAQPDYCKFATTPQEAGYEHFVEYMLYTAEQTLSVDPGWKETFTHTFKDHAQYICTVREADQYSAAVASLLLEFQSNNCSAVQACP